MKRFDHCLALAVALFGLVLSAVAPASADGKAQDPDPGSRKPPLRVSGAVTNEPKIKELKLIPPFMRDTRGETTTTALFPFYFDRRSPTGFERFIPPYYYRRGPKLNADVALGLVWSLRGPDQNTFVLPPFYTHRKGKDWGLGIAPLFFTGLFGGHDHTVIPPLLTWVDGDAKKRRLIVGAYFDFEDERKKWTGVFPFYWHKVDDVDRFTLVPPVFFRFADDDPIKFTTVVPPFYHKRRADLTAWGLVPVVFRKETPALRSTTIPLTLFHYATGPDEFRLVTPLLSYLESKKDGRTWITPLYQRRRGDRNFDAVAPLYFHTWDNRDASWGLVVPPIYWQWDDPANHTLVLMPFFGRWYREGISRSWVFPLVGRYRSLERDEQTWWVAPTFHLAWTEESWQFNVHPLFYLKDSPERFHLAIAPIYFDFRNYEEKTKRLVAFPLYWDFDNYAKQKHSLVLFPLYWDFANERKKTRRVVGFPLYWDFKDERKKKETTIALPLYYRLGRGDRVRHFSLNTFYETKKDPAGKHWQFHFFPLTSFGGGDDESWWSVLYGLAGYERRGSHRRIKALWIPFNLN